LLLWVKLDVVTLTRFPVDTILRIILCESYNGIRALADLSLCFKYTNREDNTRTFLDVRF
jgi:hypothetical protein